MESSSSTTIPLASQPSDLMREGPNSNNLAARAQQIHPVDYMQRTALAGAAEFGNLEDVRRIYGSGLAMRLATERRMAQNAAGRLPGMATPRSNVAFETVTGADLTLGFEDFLGLPQHAPSLPSPHASDPHLAMERRLGL